MVRPGHEDRYDEMLAFLETGADNLDVLDKDTQLLDALDRRGWRHAYSSFELIRPLSPGWELPEPTWPEGYRLSGIEDPAAVHELVYHRSRWLEVPGHRFRTLEEWQSIHMRPEAVPEHAVVLWQGDRPVGLALCRLFSDGNGWVGQLAVDRAHEGRGLGRALLLEGLRRQVAAGAEGLGLGVNAANRGALSLYLSVGLQIEREWLNYQPR